jgi:hypothetical protein
MWNWMRNRQEKKAAAESDFGRRFGWILLYEGRPVAELDYVRWDDVTQFWHSYTVRWLESHDLSTIPFENWPESGFVLRSKKYPEVEFTDYMASGNDGTVFLRGPHVPPNALVT